MNYAYDCHMHLLPLGHVCLSAYLEYAKKNPISEAYAQVSASDYVVSGILHHQGDVRNLVTVMEHPVAAQLALYEDDLRGVFADGSLLPLISGNGLFVTGGGKDLSYDRLVLCPLLMDFSTPRTFSSYYRTPPRHDVLEQAQEVLQGIAQYHKERPGGMLEVLPFIGINPANHSEERLMHLLETCFKKKGFLGKDGPLFAGVKVYPPMGFDPNPKDDEARAKVELLYTFCEERSIPIVTHCDDQGFRMMAQKDSLVCTSPERWEPVLERHPALYLDFAHFGEQYYAPRPASRLKAALQTRQESHSWRTVILSLMKGHPHVYADLSFDGVRPAAWDDLCTLLEQAGDDRELYEGRLLFGTDWPLSLAKTPSALSYWRGFADSAIPQELAHKMLQQNPIAFLRRKEYS